MLVTCNWLDGYCSRCHTCWRKVSKFEVADERCPDCGVALDWSVVGRGSTSHLTEMERIVKPPTAQPLNVIGKLVHRQEGQCPGK